MKRWIALLAAGLAAAYLATTLVPPGNPGALDVTGFGRLPVLAEGRIKPFDTVARSSLLILQGRQRVVTPEGRTLTPDEWLLDVLFDEPKADGYATFVIDNPDLLALVGRNDDNLTIRYDRPAQRMLATIGFLDTRYRRFSFRELAPYLPAVAAQAKLADPVDAQARTPFQRAVVQLDGELALYTRLKRALMPPGDGDFLGELLRLQERLPADVAAVRAREAGQPHDEAAAQAVIALGQKFLGMAEATNLLVVPPDAANPDPLAWENAGRALLESFGRGSVSPPVLAYAGLGYAWRRQEPAQFNHIIELYRGELARRFSRPLRQCEIETRFNAAQPFYSSMSLYVGAFLLAILSWIKWPETAARAAFGLVVVAWLATTAGIATRMGLEGRPPVTNLYSSALFIGWGSVGLCLILEAIYKNAIGSAAAGLIGFATLLIAHHLSLAGDTLEMMRAVLDSNFWLATHVVVVTTGYAATFLAGMLALIYIFRGVCTTSLDRGTADALGRMVYGIVCFATLFSFVGTVLGGIWADQSWGRFWGWDPKENGALIIVLWNALILHARWGGLVRQRGLMGLAVFGNIVTSWSWFGTNMLGIGLHSYGFTEAAFWWLSAFVASQLVVIAVANLPLEKWRSFARAG
jgi:ABC-type transport system involved in cytochrome c biogenesis permease subunit